MRRVGIGGMRAFAEHECAHRCTWVPAADHGGDVDHGGDAAIYGCCAAMHGCSAAILVYVLLQFKVLLFMEGPLTLCGASSPDFNGVDGILGFGLPKPGEDTGPICVVLSVVLVLMVGDVGTALSTDDWYPGTRLGPPDPCPLRHDRR
eukprot:615381-Rhodomonas_salina.1